MAVADTSCQPNPIFIAGQEQLCGTTCTEIGRETSSEFVSRNLEWGSHPANRTTETSLRIGNILSAKRVTWVGEPVPFVAKQAGFPRSGVEGARGSPRIHNGLDLVQASQETVDPTRPMAP